MSRTFFSDSPMYMLINSGPLTLRKLREHSVATALANRVWYLHQNNGTGHEAETYSILFIYKKMTCRETLKYNGYTKNLLSLSQEDHIKEHQSACATQRKTNPYA